MKEVQNDFMLYVPCHVIQLCNIKHRNAHFSNQCFNSMFAVFYMFRTSWVHHQEDSTLSFCTYVFRAFM